MPKRIEYRGFTLFKPKKIEDGLYVIYKELYAPFGPKHMTEAEAKAVIDAHLLPPMPEIAEEVIDSDGYMDSDKEWLNANLEAFRWFREHNKAIRHILSKKHHID